MAGVRERLLHVIFDPKRPIDKPFMAVFLVWFRYFATPMELFSYARHKFVNGGMDAKMRVAALLESWLTLHTYDFLDTLPLCKCLLVMIFSVHLSSSVCMFPRCCCYDRLTRDNTRICWRVTMIGCRECRICDPHYSGS